MAPPAPERFPGQLLLVRTVQPDPTEGPIGFESMERTEWFHRPRDLTLWDDFLYADPGNAAAGVLGQATFGPWLYVPSGGSIVASSTGVDDTTRALGVFEFSSLTSATGRAGIGMSPLSTSFRTGLQHTFGLRVMVPTLSTAAQEFEFCAGWHDGLLTGSTYAATNGIWLGYRRSAHGDFWVLHQAENGSITNTVTVQPVVAGQWLSLEIEVEWGGANPLAWFRVDGVLKRTVALQVTATRKTGMGLRLVKTNGTTARTVLVDWVAYNVRGDRQR